MSTTAATPSTTALPAPQPITIGRLVKVEMRKMFDTRSGFWLMVSIAGLSLIASLAVLVFADKSSITYGSFGAAVGVPIGILLPVMAILMVTAEWSQRTGLVSFTLVPRRSRVISAKAIAALIVGVASIVLALAIGAVFNLVAASVRGADLTWEFGLGDFGTLVLGQLVGIFMGFIIALLIRSSPGAIVAYVAWSFILPTIFGALAATQDWFANLQPWIDLAYTQSAYLFSSDMSGEHWAQLGVSALIWMGIPLVIGLQTLRRAEVK